MNNQEETFKDLFPALYKLGRVEEVLSHFKCETAFGLSRIQQNQIAAECTDKIREILGE